MSSILDAYNAHQFARFMRSDAARYMRPDAARWIRRDVARFLRPGTDPADVFPALDRKYSPNQRRIPAGSTGGGRWTDGSGGQGVSSVGVTLPALGIPGFEPDFPEGLSDDNSSYVVIDGYSNTSESSEQNFDSGLEHDYVSDQPLTVRVGNERPPVLNEFGEPYYQPGGHHEMLQSVYKKWDLSPETLEVFKNSTTGSLPKGRVSYGADGELTGHFWDDPHRAYRDAIEDLSNKFFREHDIMETSRMTPDQAQDLLAEIRKSDNPVIRDYNKAMRLIGHNFRLRLRFWRGNE